MARSIEKLASSISIVVSLHVMGVERSIEVFRNSGIRQHLD